MKPYFKLRHVLLCLDGTLINTEPNLVACLNHAVGKHAFPAHGIAQIRPLISYSSLAMNNEAAIDATQELQGAIQAGMPYINLNPVAAQSDLFFGIVKTLLITESRGLKWGVMFNKLSRYTNPLLARMRLTDRAGCNVSGDTISQSKPHSEPTLITSRQANVKPENRSCIGDAKQHILADNMTNMKTTAVFHGHIKSDDKPKTRRAPELINSSKQLSAWIQTSCH